MRCEAKEQVVTCYGCWCNSLTVLIDANPERTIQDYIDP